jgi:hypothetical protein
MLVRIRVVYNDQEITSVIHLSKASELNKSCHVLVIALVAPGYHLTYHSRVQINIIAAPLPLGFILGLVTPVYQFTPLLNCTLSVQQPSTIPD